MLAQRGGQRSTKLIQRSRTLPLVLCWWYFVYLEVLVRSVLELGSFFIDRDMVGYDQKSSVIRLHNQLVAFIQVRTGFGGEFLERFGQRHLLVLDISSHVLQSLAGESEGHLFARCLAELEVRPIRKGRQQRGAE